MVYAGVHRWVLLSFFIQPILISKTKSFYRKGTQGKYKSFKTSVHTRPLVINRSRLSMITRDEEIVCKEIHVTCNATSVKMTLTMWEIILDF